MWSAINKHFTSLASYFTAKFLAHRRLRRDKEFVQWLQDVVFGWLSRHACLESAHRESIDIGLVNVTRAIVLIAMISYTVAGFLSTGSRAFLFPDGGTFDIFLIDGWLLRMVLVQAVMRKHALIKLNVVFWNHWDPLVLNGRWVSCLLFRWHLSYLSDLLISGAHLFMQWILLIVCFRDTACTLIRTRIVSWTYSLCAVIFGATWWDLNTAENIISAIRTVKYIVSGVSLSHQLITLLVGRLTPWVSRKEPTSRSIVL